MTDLLGRTTDQRCHGTHTRHVGGAATFGPDQSNYDTHVRRVGAISADPARCVATPTDDAQDLPATRPAQADTPPNPVTPDGWLILRIWAESYYDCEQHYIALNNRARRGGVPPELFAGMLEGAHIARKEAGRALLKTYSHVVPASIIEWQQTSRGIGAHSLARLLGVIGDPCIATPLRAEGRGADRVTVADGDPYMRSVSQLWRYCGWSPDHRPAAGMTQAEVLGCGKGQAKMRSFLLAQACVIQRGPYREVYDEVKAKAHAAHEDWSKGHADNHAKRILAKRILRDLWRARRQDFPADQGTPDTQISYVGGEPF